jgi:hypothetical protein
MKSPQGNISGIQWKIVCPHFWLYLPSYNVAVMATYIPKIDDDTTKIVAPGYLLLII